MDDTWPDDDLQPPDVAWRIDAACQSFETTWQSGDAPRLETYLGDATPPVRGPLLRELVLLDSYYRGRRGERPAPEDYQTRCPELPAEWLRAALAADAAETLPAAPPAAGPPPGRVG